MLGCSLKQLLKSGEPISANVNTPPWLRRIEERTGRQGDGWRSRWTEGASSVGFSLSPLLFRFAFLFARIVYPSSQVDSRPLERETKENEPENIRKQYIVPAIDWLPPISNHPETSYINIPAAEDVRYDTVRDSNRGKDTGCFLPDIAFQESIPLFGLRTPDIYWK